MRALVCHHVSDDRSGVRVEAHWPEPAAPGPGQVTVALTVAALDARDLCMVSGGDAGAPPPPFIPGTAAAGHIEAVGEDVSGELVGERVIVQALHGCLAERITVPIGAARSIPDGLHDREAAMLGDGASPPGLEVPLARVAEAFAALASGSIIGKAVILL